MLTLPSSESPIREAFDVADLAAKRWVTLPNAKFSASRMFAESKGIAAINSLVLRANGDLHLMQFGPRGGKKSLWNFGRAPV